jgi:hypothetical protein
MTMLCGVRALRTISMTSRRYIIYSAKRWPNRAVSAMPGARTLLITVTREAGERSFESLQRWKRIETAWDRFERMRSTSSSASETARCS